MPPDSRRKAFEEISATRNRLRKVSHNPRYPESTKKLVRNLLLAGVKARHLAEETGISTGAIAKWGGQKSPLDENVRILPVMPDAIAAADSEQPVLILKTSAIEILVFSREAL